jgi:hypothetical protein
MTPDQLDGLLDRSAPALVDRGTTRETALRQMVRDSRVAGRPVRPRRRTVIGVAAAVAACSWRQEEWLRPQDS